MNDKPEIEKTEGIQQMLVSFMKKLLGRDFLLMAIFIVVVAYFTLYSRATFAQEIQNRVEADSEKSRQESKATREELERHIRDDAEFRRYVLQYLHELSADNRAMYRTIQTGVRQERLERPIESKDGGL